MNNKSVKVFMCSSVHEYLNTYEREYRIYSPNTLTLKHFENLLCAES